MEIYLWYLVALGVAVTDATDGDNGEIEVEPDLQEK